MKMLHIDPELRRIANLTRRELEDKQLRVRLKRCEKGIAHSPAWEQNWETFIQNSVAHAVTDYLSKRPPLSQMQNKQPAAVQSTQPATQVAQPQNAAVASYKRF